MSTKSDIGGIAAVGVLGYILIKKVGNIGGDVTDSMKEIITNNSYVEKLSTNWNTEHDTTRIYSSAGSNQVQQFEPEYQKILDLHPNKGNYGNYTLGGTNYNDILATNEANRISTESLSILDRPQDHKRYYNDHPNAPFSSEYQKILRKDK